MRTALRDVSGRNSPLEPHSTIWAPETGYALTFLPVRTTLFPGSLSYPSSLSLGRASRRKPWQRGCPCAHLQNLSLHPWLAVSCRLWNQCPNEGRREAQIILKLELEGLGGCIFKIFISELRCTIFIWIFFVCVCGGGGGEEVKFWYNKLFWKPPSPWDVINDRSLFILFNLF